MSLAVATGFPWTSLRTALCLLGLLAGGCKSIEGPPPLLIDPFGLNWRVEQRDLGSGRYAILMTKNLLTTGGDGESARMFRRRVDEIQRERGYSSFEVSSSARASNRMC